MTVTTGSNISSLRVQRNLSENSSNLANTFQRLSSGLRINKASDDAAGLAIAESLKSDRRVYLQGSRNLNDGISLLNIASSAVTELTNVLQRLKELAEQAANGAYTVGQREALDLEAQALSDEFFRVVKSTKFNDKNLFEASFGQLALQAGFGDSSVIANSLGGVIGTGTFSSSTSFAIGSGTNTFGLVSGDFNGDGILDIATSNYGSDSISIQIGTGNGSFTHLGTYASGNGPAVIESYDFNNDGILDLVYSNSLDGNIGIRLGNGDGTFGTQSVIATGTQATGISGADFNNDGYMDLAVANAGASSVSILLGSSNGTFTAANSLTTTNNPTSVATGDFNGDGKIDLVTSQYLGAGPRVFLGNGDGTFDSGTVYAGSSGLIYSVISADFNNDGNLDFAGVDRALGKVNVYLNNGSGTFAASVTYATGGTINGSWSIDVGDFDGDGSLDIVTANVTDNSIAILRGNGNGTFNTAVTYSAGTDPRFLVAADFTGDGVLDIATANASTSRIGILKSNTTTGIAPLLEFSLKTISDAKQALTIFNNKTDQLNSQQSQIGAFESRLIHATNVIDATIENFINAESRILDVDIADETSKMIRLQVTQQASTAVLAQANLQPQIVLQLLRQ